MNKKRVWLLAIVTVVLLILVVNVTYAYFTSTSGTSSSTVVIGGKTDCLDIDFSTNSNEVSLPYNYPVSDDFATSNITPVEIEVTNKCTNVQKDIKYTLVLTTLANANDNSIDNSKLRMRILKDESIFKANNYLSNLPVLGSGNTYELLNKALSTNNLTKGYTNKNVYIIDESEISSKGTQKYKVYLWIDYYEGDQNAYSGQAHNSSYDNSSRNKEFKGIYSLIVNS